MDAKQAINASANLSSIVLKTYLSDLEDADLMRRPGEDCNHLAWQLGHLIASEVQLLEQVAPGVGPELPSGFADAHATAARTSDNPDDFFDKQTYIDLFDQVRTASKSALEASSPSDLDAPSPENFRSFCPTMGDMYTLIATHPMMHAGQFVVVRRQLGKPILM